MIEKIKELIKDDENILFGYLFGSILSDDFSKYSDIDIALYFKNYTFDKYLETTHKLQKQLKRDIDLVVLNNVKNIYLLEEILYKSKLLKDNDKRIDFELYKWHEINDFKISKRLIDAA